MAEPINVTGSLSPVNVDNLWTINNFSSFLNNTEAYTFIQSPYFVADEYKWKFILLTTNSIHSLDRQDWISITVNFKMERTEERTNDFRIQIKLSLVNSRNEEVNIRHISNNFCPSYCSADSDFVKKSFLLDPSNGLLLDDKLVVRCNIVFLDQTVNLPLDKPSSELETLFENKDFTDVTLRVANGEEIHAHKAI